MPGSPSLSPPGKISTHRQVTVAVDHVALPEEKMLNQVAKHLVVQTRAKSEYTELELN